MKNFAFDPKTTLNSRIKPIPTILLTAWQELDEHDDYAAYTPSLDELKIIKYAISTLPPLCSQAMEERLIGIYFISNFISSGATDWIVDKDNNIYTYMIFNPDTFKMNISELLTKKEKTCFINNDPDFNIQIDVGSIHNSFLYILLHESTHVVDYIYNITPFAEPVILQIQPNRPHETAFTASKWNSYNESKTKNSFRNAVSFYGIGKPASMKISEAAKIYRALNNSPFVSLYGSLNWAEDLAEFLSFYHLTEILGLNYTINVFHSDKLIYSVEPTKNKKIRDQFKHLQVFYSQEFSDSK